MLSKKLVDFSSLPYYHINMKKTAFFTGIFVVLAATSFLPFWNDVYSFFNTRSRKGEFSQLNFRSLDGEYTVYIDNEDKGKVKDKEQRDFTQIKPGLRSIKLIRTSSIKDFFYTLERSIYFLPSSQVEISWEAGPTLESSTGVIKYFTEIAKQGSEVYIQAFPKNANVEFDSRKTEGNIFEVFDTNTHTVKVANGEGFDPQSFQVNLTDESTKKNLTGLRLVIEVYLYKRPV